MNSKIILFNNKFETEPKISLASQTVCWGKGVFTTMRTYNGKVFELDRHIERVTQNALEVGIDLKYNSKEIKKMVFKTTEKSNQNNQKIKIIIINEGVLITAEELKINSKIYNGVSCKIINSTRSLPHIKKTSYLDSIVPNNLAKNEGYYDAILMDQNGFVTEGAFCNIFWFEGDILCTVEDYILPGITRQIVLENAPFKIQYKKIMTDELKQKSEVFLTQSTTGIVPIIKIDDTKIGDGKSGTKTMEVSKMFARLVQK